MAGLGKVRMVQRATERSAGAVTLMVHLMGDGTAVSTLGVMDKDTRRYTFVSLPRSVHAGPVARALGDALLTAANDAVLDPECGLGAY